MLEDWTTILDAGQVVGHRDPAGAPMSSAALFDYGESLLSIAWFSSPRRTDGAGSRVP